MGERHDAEHSVAKARQRLTEITEELSRRATGDYVKGRALEAKDRMTHRAKVEARERTFEMRDKMINSPWLLGLVGGAVGAIAGKKLGDKAKHSKLDSGDYGRMYDQNYRGDYSGAYGRYYGQDYGQQDYGQSYGQNYGTAGYGYDERYAGSYDRPYDEYTATQQTTVAFVEPEAGLDVNQESSSAYEGDSGSNLKEKVSGAAASAKEKVSEFGHQAKDKASHLKHRAQDKASHAKYRARGKADEIKHRAQDFRERHASDDNSPGLRERLPSREQFRGTAHNVKARANDKPELFALGALAIGAIFGALMPLSRREQQYLGPARAKAEGQIDNLKHQAMDKVRDVQHQVQKKAGIAGALLGTSGSKKEQNEEHEERSSNVGGGSDFHEDAGLQAGSSFGTTHVATYDAPAYGADSGSTDIDTRGTFSAGGEQQENREEGGTWTPTYDPDVTRH